jgi:NAD(P)-dependent dehydrogenase (short-subunit alcohol dehydrogenase family)
MIRVLITGANRGVGFALAEEFSKHDGVTILAACRKPEDAAALRSLQDASNQPIHLLQIDISERASIEACAASVGELAGGVDILINNAGILPGGVDSREPNHSALGYLEAEAMLDLFRINTVAPVIVTQAFLDLLRKGSDSRVVNISSDAGSLGLRNNGCDYSYSASKAALNMMTRCLNGDLASDGILAVAVHPGFLRTDMGGGKAPHSLKETIPSLVRLIMELTPKQSGTFLNWDGRQIEW